MSAKPDGLLLQPGTRTENVRVIISHHLTNIKKYFSSITLQQQQRKHRQLYSEQKQVPALALNTLSVAKEILLTIFNQ